MKKVELFGIELYLMPQKTVYIPFYNMLLLADWHLGKAAHFRKYGIGLPQPEIQKEFDEIQNIAKEFDIKQILLLGDLFHSNKNNDWNKFSNFISNNHPINFTLIKGNHDIISNRDYHNIGLNIQNEVWLNDHILCTHQPVLNTGRNILNIAGHIHPGFRIKGKARQFYQLPCFYLEENKLVLPAYGTLTGLCLIPQNDNNKLFPIIGNEVIEVNGTTL